MLIVSVIIVPVVINQVALKAINDIEIKSKLVWNYVQVFSQLASQNRVTLLWVPGHIGHQGNEEADSLVQVWFW